VRRSEGRNGREERNRKRRRRNLEEIVNTCELNMKNQYTHKFLRWHVDSMSRACCRGVGEVKDEENYWKHHTYLQSHLHHGASGGPFRPNTWSEKLRPFDLSRTLKKGLEKLWYPYCFSIIGRAVFSDLETKVNLALEREPERRQIQRPFWPQKASIFPCLFWVETVEYSKLKMNLELMPFWWDIQTFKMHLERQKFLSRKGAKSRLWKFPWNWYQSRLNSYKENWVEKQDFSAPCSQLEICQDSYHFQKHFLDRKTHRKCGIFWGFLELGNSLANSAYPSTFSALNMYTFHIAFQGRKYATCQEVLESWWTE
jgi:hypothetical protein